MRNDSREPSPGHPEDVPVLRNDPSTGNQLPRVLVLAESEADGELISNELHSTGMRIMTARVDSADAFIAALDAFAPDVVLSGHPVGAFGSLELLEMVRAARPTAAFIIVTDALTDAESVAAIRAGAEDLILKMYVSRITASINDALAVRRPLRQLTSRQVEVLQLVAQGARTRDIADRLGLSIKTIESHRGEIMKRLRLHDLVSVVRYAMRVGLVSSGDLSQLSRGGR